MVGVGCLKYPIHPMQGGSLSGEGSRMTVQGVSARGNGAFRITISLAASAGPLEDPDSLVLRNKVVFSRSKTSGAAGCSGFYAGNMKNWHITMGVMRA